MGVVVHALDRRTVTLDVAGTRHEVGTLRHVSKLTELDGRRTTDLARAAALPSPPAAMVATPVHLPLAEGGGDAVAAHLVLGWDEGRGSVTDMGWDYLPVLGHAVRDAARGVFVLHELRDGTLHPLDRGRAAVLELLAEDGSLRRQGQPVIAQCRAVQSYGPEFAVADCVLEGGRRERIYMRLAGEAMPDPSWLVGRRPMDLEHHEPGTAAGMPR